MNGFTLRLGLTLRQKGNGLLIMGIRHVDILVSHGKNLLELQYTSTPSTRCMLDMVVDVVM